MPAANDIARRPMLGRTDWPFICESAARYRLPQSDVIGCGPVAATTPRACQENPMLKLPGHSRYAYSPIVNRADYSWPGGKRLAFYIALNIEHFAFGTGLGMDPVHSNQQNSRHYAWRDYGSR